mgnify:CR=1 FL=1
MPNDVLADRRDQLTAEQREAPGFSIEESMAQTLDLEVGDLLSFDVAGQRVEAPVTSILAVAWDSFNVNFFVIAPRSLLGGEAATYVTSFHLPQERAALIPQLVRAFAAGPRGAAMRCA